MAQLKVGFIGCGRISTLHALAYRGYERAELAAIADSNSVRLEQSAAEWGVDTIYKDYRALLDDKRIDAVEILLPHKLHHQATLEALAADKHVSLQKPMAMTMSECDSIVDAAASSDKLVRVFENCRFHAPYVKAKQLVDEGAIGTPVTIRLKLNPVAEGGWPIDQETMSWHMTPSEAGGTIHLFDDGYHKWSTVYWIMGEVEKVQAWMDIVGDGNIRVDLPGVVMWKHKAPARYGVWDIALSHDMKIPGSKYYALDERLEITGTAGVIWVNGLISRMIQDAPVQLYRDGVLSSYQALETDWAASFVAGSRDFCDAILDARTSQLSPREGRAIQKLAMASVASLMEHREIVLDEFHAV